MPLALSLSHSFCVPYTHGLSRLQIGVRFVSGTLASSLKNPSVRADSKEGQSTIRNR
jgi:hypothetical protein